MKRVLIGLTLLGAFGFSGSAMASTFVGNGGSSGDIELTVTQNQISETLRQMTDKENTAAYCECTTGLKGHDVCEPLNDLAPEQKTYCDAELRALAPRLRDLLKSDKIRIQWTDQSIVVREGGDTRAVEAVANPKTNTITVNRDQFVRLRPAKRVFLLAHEYLHFIDKEGKTLDDSGPKGPFKGQEGGRNFLNAMASGITSQAYERRAFHKYASSLTRSKGYLSNWLSLNYQKTFLPEDSENNFSQDELEGFDLSYFHFFSNHGFFLEVEQAVAEKDVYSNTTFTETQNTASLGYGLRYFPFDDPLSFSGQSYFKFQLGLSYLASVFEAKDQSLSFQDEANSLGYMTGLSYYFPLQKDLWWQVGAQLSYFDFKYDEIDLGYDKVRGSAQIGVSYAF